MAADSGAARAREGSPRGRWRFGTAWLQRVNTTLVLLVLLGGLGLAAKAVSARFAREVSVPGTYVKVRGERGGFVEARALPAESSDRGLPAGGVAGPVAGGTAISMDVTLADVADVVRLIQDVGKVRVVLPCPVARRVSLRARDASVQHVLEAVAAAAGLTLTARGGTFVLSACPPPPQD